MKAFLEQYGISIFVIIIIGIMVLMANGVGLTVEDLVKKEIKRFAMSAGKESWNGNNNGNLNGTVDENGKLVIEDIVIDYGLPVKLNLPKVGSAKISTDKSSASYGDLVFDGDNTSGNWSVIYTPNQILMDVDEVKLVLEDDTEYKFNVIPATTMYYETDFADGVFDLVTTGENWSVKTKGTKADSFQECKVVGNRNLYGFSSAYKNVSNLSNGSSLFVEGQGINRTTAKFSFKGTGFDLISRTGAEQSALRVEIFTDEARTAENRIKSITVMNKGELELYQIPVVSVNNLAYDTYYVTIHVNAAYHNDKYPQLSRGGEFYFDAIRIYDSVKGNNIAEEAYKADGEAYPEYNEIRNLILNASSLSGSEVIQGSVFIDKIGGTVSVSDYTNNGPNNEVYLDKGQAISFRISNADYEKISKIALGTKSLNGTSSSINISTLNGSEKTISTKSTTDMFYDITDCVSFEDDGVSKIIVIKNTGSELVSITDLKVTYKSNPSSLTTFVTSVEDANKVIDSLN